MYAFHVTTRGNAAAHRLRRRGLNGRYARRFNARHGRSGHLFEGPYAAEPVTGDAHLTEACRSIAMNPVRAGLCRRPEDWPWSGYPAHAGVRDRDDFLSSLPLPFDSAEDYVAFVTAELDDCNLVETRLQAT